VRERKDGMKVGNRQKLVLPRLDPSGTSKKLTLRAVPVAAGVIGNFFLTATGAPPDMPSQDFRPAIGDVLNDFALIRA